MRFVFFFFLMWTCCLVVKLPSPLPWAFCHLQCWAELMMDDVISWGSLAVLCWGVPVGPTGYLPDVLPQWCSQHVPQNPLSGSPAAWARVAGTQQPLGLPLLLQPQLFSWGNGPLGCIFRVLTSPCEPCARAFLHEVFLGITESVVIQRERFVPSDLSLRKVHKRDKPELWGTAFSVYEVKVCLLCYCACSLFVLPICLV